MKMQLFKISTFYFLTALGLTAQEMAVPTPVVCYAAESSAFTSRIAHASSNFRREASSDIVVTYTGFPASAQLAFEYAVSIWERELSSTVPIRINASWEALNGNTLAFSGATRIYRNLENVSVKDVWYIGPLAEALTGSNLNDDDFDINVTLNSHVKWSYSTTGATINGRFDLVTVVLHEIAHGLGFSSSFKLTEDALGTWGQNDFPFIYDVFIENNAGQLLLENFGNNSLALGNQLTSQKLYFSLFGASSSKLYSPSPFKNGASISHLDTDFYPAGSANSLMSPSIQSAEVMHEPGDLILGMLAQMGWPLNGQSNQNVLANASEIEVAITVYPNPVLEQLHVAVPASLRSEQTSLNLWSPEGKLLKKNQANTFQKPIIKWSMATYPAGVYLLVISSEKGRFAKRLVKY